MSEYLVFMTCDNGHQWARVGHDNGEGGITLGRCTPGSDNDPSYCSKCRQQAKRYSVVAAPRQKRQPKVDMSRQQMQRREREKLAAWNANANS